MKITVFTSNHRRHLYLINAMSKISSKLNVIIETSTIFHGARKGFYQKSIVKKQYFHNVKKAEKKIFKNEKLDISKKVNLKILQHGDLNLLNKNDLKDYLLSDIFIVFGSSFIKGWLLKFLKKKRAINIHMGISPYYKGTDCNFWALKDNKKGYVGATIHLLNNNLDGGPILYHSISEFHPNPFIYTMSTTKSAIKSLKKYILEKKIFKLKPIRQNYKKNIRHTKKIDFTDEIIKQFFKENKKKKYEYERPNLKDFYLLKKSFFFK